MFSTMLPVAADPLLHASNGQAELHDDLLGGAWSPPGYDDDDEAGRTIAEIDALLGELIAELES
jgi:hypothetical protein